MENKAKTCFKIFLSTFCLSAFTFGGGYVIVSLMQKKYVDELRWISREEMLNITAAAQSAPGPVAVNAAILVGYHMAGIWGTIPAVLGTVLPPLVIITVISHFYTEFRDNTVVNALLSAMRAGVAAVIADVVISLAGHIRKGKKALPVIIAVGTFVAAYVFKVNVIFIMLACGFLGVMNLGDRNQSEKGGEGK